MDNITERRSTLTAFLLNLLTNPWTIASLHYSFLASYFQSKVKRVSLSLANSFVWNFILTKWWKNGNSHTIFSLPCLLCPCQTIFHFIYFFCFIFLWPSCMMKETSNFITKEKEKKMCVCFSFFFVGSGKESSNFSPNFSFQLGCWWTKLFT